jgi:hypothetical protein
MKGTKDDRTFVRAALLFLVGAGLAACGASPPTVPGSSVSTHPLTSSSTSALASTIAVVSPSSSGNASRITPTPDPTSGWPTFRSAAGKLSFRYEPAWKPVECAPNDSPLIVLGHNTCGQIEPSFAVDSIPSSRAPTIPDLRCDASQPRASASSVKVDGVTGVRVYLDYTAAAYDDCRHPIEHAVVYSFYTHGRAYTVTYLYVPSEGADQMTAVDRMVHTLTFTA